MKPSQYPSVVLLAGPNGAGKSTSAPQLLAGTLAVREFVNADAIAHGLSSFDAERAAVAAGRVMLARLHQLAAQRISFAFETTLASRSFAPWIADLTRSGYRFHLIYLWLSSVDLAIARVAARASAGGHDVPATTIRRRYHAGIANFFCLYSPLAVTWRFCDNSGTPPPKPMAQGERNITTVVSDRERWKRLQDDYT